MKSNPVSPQDVVAVSDLKINPGRVLTQMDKTHRPAPLTSRGRGVG